MPDVNTESTHERPEKSMLDALREKQPDATEREAWLLEHLIGSMGMVRSLMTHGTYTWGHDYQKDAFEQFNDWLLEQYGWKLAWKARGEPKKPRRKAS